MAPELIRKRRRWRWRSLVLLLAVLGPGFITASAGNDVGGITTYSQAGAHFGYRILWVLIPLALALIVVQEMATRMAAVTGKGLAALIRENFGVRVSFFAMAAFFAINLVITATEFAGIAAASEIFHISRFIAVPVAMLIVLILVFGFNSKSIDRAFVCFSLIYFCYIASAILAHPNWGAVAHGAAVPAFDFNNRAYLVMVVGLIGTTISPYMQFFLQSAVVEKGSDERELTLARADVISGSILAIAIAGFMIIANAATIFTANRHGAHIAPLQAADYATALRPLAGAAASIIFALGIFNAGLFTATVLPLSTSYVICEAFGFEAALDRKFYEAPVFFTLFAIGLIAGGALVLIPHLPLLNLIFYAQVAQGILLPPELVLMLIIVNKRGVMGRHTNGWFGNTVAWATVALVGALSIYYAVTQVFGGTA